MRGRHNIVGTEVGRPRPPVYLSRPSRLESVKPQGGRRWIILLIAAGVSGLGLIIAAVS